MLHDFKTYCYIAVAGIGGALIVITVVAHLCGY